jgi:hypothetical protein
LSQPITSISNASARFATAWPIAPSPNDAQRGPLEASGLGRELLLVPLAALDLCGLIGDAPVAREQEPHRQFSHRDRVCSRAVADADALGCRRGHIDIVDARPGADDGPQPLRPLQHRGRHLGRAHDDDFRPGALYRRDKAFDAGGGLKCNRGAELSKRINGGLLELVSDQDVHG